MRFSIFSRGLNALILGFVLCLVALTVNAAPFAYISNGGSNTASVINTATNTVVATVWVGSGPKGVAVNPAGTFAYVTNSGTNTVSVINTATNAVVATVTVGLGPLGVAVNPAGTFAYVASYVSNTVSVIDTATNTVAATVPVGAKPQGIAVNSAGTFVYVANFSNGSISVIDTATNSVVATVPIGGQPLSVAVNPAGTFAYVASPNSASVHVIDTATNTVVATVVMPHQPYGVAVNPAGTFVYATISPIGKVAVINTATNTVDATVTVGSWPEAIGNFIGPATTPGAPTIGTATSGNAQATVTFTAPASDGGSAITGYTATCGGITGTNTASPITVTGLTNGTAYTCTVTAANAVGTGAASAASNSVTPATVPGAPTIGTATAGNAQATVAFAAPGSTGGSAITGYTANCGGITNTGASSPITVTGLTNGTAYTCTVTATNAVGTGAASAASNSVTPLGSQTITFGAAPSITVGGTGTVSATGGASGNPVTFTSTTTGVCTISGSTITGITVGTCTIAANQTGNATYAAAPQVTQNIGVGISSQTITFGAAPSVTVGGTGTVSATGGASGNAVTFTSTTTGICTVSGIAAGTCTIAANQTGNANYAAASQVTQNITVTPAPVNGACGTANGVAVSSAPAANLCVSGSASAVAGSGPWTWSCSGSNGGTSASCSAPVTSTVAAPTCTLTANPASITVGGTSVLTVSCDQAAAYYSWSSNTGFGGSVSGGTVSPSATATYSVTGYNDGGAGNTASATVTVKPVVYALAVTRSGTGTGTVTGNGINCGATCSASFNSGTSVTLTASPATGSYFEGWSGECSGTGSCVVTMNAAKNVTATFKPVPFDASVTSSITATSATASATVDFKDEDKGKPGAVYVTAWVRFGGLATMGISAASLSRGVHASSAGSNPSPAGEADNRQAALYKLLAAADANSNDFVLIQLTSSGWQLVVDGQLTPYESGALGDSLAYLSLLNNADTTSLLGAQFCVGYGTSQAGVSSVAEMISAGRMQTVLTISDPNSASTANGSCNIAATVQGQAIEFYKADINHYFVTASAEEALFLNSKTDWNWVRTGMVFNAGLPSSASGNASPVCRFFGVFANGTVGSHFYTVDADECEYVKGRLDWGWGYEGDAFNAVKPADGACPSGTSPVYRLYNDGMGGAPNHRYVTSQTDVNVMVARGWVSEGTAFCVVQ